MKSIRVVNDGLNFILFSFLFILFLVFIFTFFNFGLRQKYMIKV